LTELALGIDLGGTELRAGLFTREGALVARRQVATDARGGPDAVVGQMAALVASLRTDATIVGIGVASPGPLDGDRGVVIFAPTLDGWHDVPLPAMLTERTGLPARLENDANAAALGEWRAGAGVGLRHMVYVTVSTGIGGGVIADGRLLRGRHGMAAELGHMAVTADPIPCVCGGHGCFEALASGSALGVAGRAKGFATARHVTEAARGGDTLALDLLRREAALLGRGFASLLHLFSPELVVVGGGVADAFDLMSADITRVMQASAMPAYRDVPVKRAALGHDAGLFGAASLVWPDAKT